MSTCSVDVAWRGSAGREAVSSTVRSTPCAELAFWLKPEGSLAERWKQDGEWKRS